MSDVAIGAAGTPPTSAVTIYDVARECGLAASTVSRAYSRPGRMRAETAQRVHEAAERLGYHAHPVTPSGPGPASSLVALAGSRLSDAAVRHLARRTPLVTVNRVVAGVPAAVVDHALGERRVLEHLAHLGHRSVAYLAGPEASWVDGTRWRAVREVSEELGLRVRRLGPFAPTVAGGLAAAGALLETPSTAVVAYNDLVAMGVLRRLAEHGVTVPGDVSVVGFDNIFGSDFCDPALTTVAAPLRALGAEAVARLLAQLGGCPSAAGTPTVVPARLVVRGSTGRARPIRSRTDPPGRPHRSRKSTSPADGTTRVSGSAAIASRSTPAGSR